MPGTSYKDIGRAGKPNWGRRGTPESSSSRKPLLSIPRLERPTDELSYQSPGAIVPGWT